MKKISILFFLFISLHAYTQNCTGRLTGHVHNSTTHENLEWATVTLHELNKVITTNANGDFVFDSLCRGTYTLLITHATHDTVVRRVNLIAASHLDIDLPLAKQILSEVTVQAQRTVPSTGIKKELAGRELEETRGQSLAEALSRLAGVNTLQTGATISKPVIHGLHGNRILTINNGVRQEGQQWGNEHAPEIDPFIANRLTVVKGVDELRYGSDAIGGVILVEPRGLRTTPGYAATLNSVYFTNNMQHVVSGVFEQQLKNLPAFTYRLQGTFKKGANVATPIYRLNNTALEETNFSATAGWRKQQWSTELFYSFFKTRLGIFAGAHIGNLTDLQNAIQQEKPDPTFTGQNTYRIRRPYQAVRHQLLKWRTSLQYGDHRFSLLVAGQLNNREEYDVVRSSTNTRPQLDLNIATLTEEITWEMPRRNNLAGTLGVTAIQQENQYSGRYFIPAYRAYNWGGFFIEKWNLYNWEAQAGIRYDYKTINTNRLRAGGNVFDQYSFDFSTLGSSFNVGYRAHEHWKINSNIALASRAPHVNELLSNGIHHGTATYEEGDINLKPEQSLNISLNTAYSNTKGTVLFDVTLYNNRIKNFIYQQPVPDEPVLTISGAFPKWQYRQTDALLQGADVSFVLKPSAQWEWSTKYSLLRARNRRLNDWLIQMPADRVRNELTYHFKEGNRWSKSYISAEMMNVWQQKRTPDDRNGKQDYKVAPAGYTLINMDAATTIRFNKQPLTIGIGVRNLLNTRYREYLNSMRYFTDEVGRNVQFRISLPIEHLY